MANRTAIGEIIKVLGQRDQRKNVAQAQKPEAGSGGGASWVNPLNHHVTHETGGTDALPVSDTMINNRTVDDTSAPAGNTGLLTAILGFLANRIKAITGKSSWITSPAITLEQSNTNWLAMRETHEPTGFQNRTDSTLSFVDGTRMFTITGTFNIYINGVKFEKTTVSKEIANTVGLHYIYFDASGVIQESTVFPGFTLPLIATIYWNGSAGRIGEERHGLTMDWATHQYLHSTIGTRYRTGLGGVFTNTTLSIDTGMIQDEDIEISIDPTQTQCRVFYRSGTTWLWSAKQNAYYIQNAGNMRYDNAGTIADASNNNYVAYWVFASNDIETPISVIMGQRQDNTIAAARLNNKYESLVLTGLPFAEMKLLYRVIVRNNATPYEETEDLRSVLNLPAGTYVATSHGVLTGRDVDDSHPATAVSIADSGNYFTGDDVELALQEIGSINSFQALTEKVSLDDNDLFLIEDSGASYARKKVRKANISGGSSSGVTDYAEDSANHSGLNFAYKAGKVRDDVSIYATAAGSVLLTDNTTNYIEVNPTSGVVTTSTTGFTSSRVPLFVVVTSGGAINTVTDDRCFFKSGGTGIAWFSSSELPTTTSVTTGLAITAITKP